MLKHSLAILALTTIPAMAADSIVSSHEVRFDQVAFTCGEINQGGKVVRFIHSNPGAKFIQEFQPSADNPLAKSWDITYRIICEGGFQHPISAHAGSKGSLR